MTEPTAAVHPLDPVEEEPAAQPSAPAGRRLAAAGLGVVALFAALVAVARPTDVATPPSTSPPESEIRLPVAIPDATEPRPASPGLASSPDWEALDAGLLQPGITPWEPVWTGNEIVFQRVRGELIAYRPATDTWRELAPPPIPIEGGGTSALWADDELIMWTDGAAAAWDPHTDDWRVLFRRLLEPSPTRRIVWTGDEVVDIDAALAVDPVDGSARGIASAPTLAERATVVWADGRIVAIPRGGAYDPAIDAWSDAPPSGLTPLAADGVWTGSELFAADYLMEARGYEPVDNAWSSYPDVPLRFSECAPSVHVLVGSPVVAHCSGIALWDPTGSRWLPVALPGLSADDVVSTGDELYAVTGYGTYRLAAEVVGSGPRRLAAGGSLLDLPDGWAVGAVDTGATGGGPAAEHVITITLEGPAAECRVRAIQADAGSVIGRFLVPGHEIAVFDLAVGGEPVEAVSVPAGAYDDDHHLVWATDSTDAVDVACSGAGATAEIARNVWSPWQRTA